MFSIQKFFSHDAKFFDLLEASADETRALTQLLIDLLKDRSHPRPLHEFALARGKDKRITDQISEELVNTFVTGLEREDIETLSYAMYRICKSIEKFAERFNLAPQRLAAVDFTQQIESCSGQPKHSRRWSDCYGRCRPWKRSRQSLSGCRCIAVIRREEREHSTRKRAGIKRGPLVVRKSVLGAVYTALLAANSPRSMTRSTMGSAHRLGILG